MVIIPMNAGKIRFITHNEIVAIMIPKEFSTNPLQMSNENSVLNKTLRAGGSGIPDCTKKFAEIPAKAISTGILAP